MPPMGSSWNDVRGVRGAQKFHTDEAASDRLKICYNHSLKYYPDLGSDDMRDHYGISLLIPHAQMSFHEETNTSDATNTTCWLFSQDLSMFVVLVYSIQWRGHFWFGCQCWCLVMKSVSLVLSVPSWSHVVSSFTKRQRISRNSSKKRQEQIRNMMLCDWVPYM